MCALAKGTLMCVTSLYKEGSRIQFTEKLPSNHSKGQYESPIYLGFPRIEHARV